MLTNSLSVSWLNSPNLMMRWLMLRFNDKKSENTADCFNSETSLSNESAACTCTRNLSSKSSDLTKYPSPRSKPTNPKAWPLQLDATGSHAETSTGCSKTIQTKLCFQNTTLGWWARDLPPELRGPPSEMLLVHSSLDHLSAAQRNLNQHLMSSTNMGYDGLMKKLRIWAT